MNREDFDKYLEYAFDRSRQVLKSKGKEYSTNEDVFHNFNRATGLSFHDGREKVAWEFLCKHLQSIKDMLNQVESGTVNHPTKEIVSEKFGDAINYLLLIEGMIIDKIDKYETFKERNSPTRNTPKCTTAEDLGITDNN